MSIYNIEGSACRIVLSDLFAILLVARLALPAERANVDRLGAIDQLESDVYECLQEFA